MVGMNTLSKDVVRIKNKNKNKGNKNEKINFKKNVEEYL